MAPEKRKRALESDRTRPEKKAKPSKVITKLIVPKEEPAFQRGGASILTPLEKKQIQTEAVKDALFEQSTGQTVRNPEYEDEDGEDDGELASGKASGRPKANTKAKRKRVTKAETEETPGMRIEGLSYKV